MASHFPAKVSWIRNLVLHCAVCNCEEDLNDAKGKEARLALYGIFVEAHSVCDKKEAQKIKLLPSGLSFREQALLHCTAAFIQRFDADSKEDIAKRAVAQVDELLRTMSA